MNRPSVSEFNPRFQYYVNLVEEGEFFELFAENTIKTVGYFKSIPAKNLNDKYAIDKWTIKEVLMHIIDTERAFAYRAFVCGRGDAETPLYGMDENLYNKNTDVTNRTIDSLLAEFVTVRNNSTVFFENLTDEQSQFLGNAISYKVSARALAYIMIGHVSHHINIITERYLQHE